jgi:hypothetical protein
MWFCSSCLCIIEHLGGKLSEEKDFASQLHSDPAQHALFGLFFHLSPISFSLGTRKRNGKKELKKRKRGCWRRYVKNDTMAKQSHL